MIDTLVTHGRDKPLKQKLVFSVLKPKKKWGKLNELIKVRQPSKFIELRVTPSPLFVVRYTHRIDPRFTSRIKKRRTLTLLSVSSRIIKIFSISNKTLVV